MTATPQAGIDDVDRLIIHELQRDGRMTTQALARKVGISEVTARRRLRRLQADGTMQIVAVVDPFLAGIESPAFVGVKVRRDLCESVALTLAKHPQVRYVGAATGNAHLIVEVMTSSNSDLASFLLDELGKIDGVIDSETWLILRVYKQTWAATDEG